MAQPVILSCQQRKFSFTYCVATNRRLCIAHIAGLPERQLNALHTFWYSCLLNYHSLENQVAQGRSPHPPSRHLLCPWLAGLAHCAGQGSIDRFPELMGIKFVVTGFGKFQGVEENPTEVLVSDLSALLQQGLLKLHGAGAALRAKL